jgi:AcrR family transcriptional regulator
MSSVPVTAADRICRCGQRVACKCETGEVRYESNVRSNFCGRPRSSPLPIRASRVGPADLPLDWWQRMISERTAFDEKLDTILSAAAGVFADKGYHNASIRDVARAAGVSLSGLYYYFQSKEELLYLVQDNALGSLIGRLEERLAGEADPERRVRILIENQLTYFVSNMAEMKVLSHEAGSLEGDYRRRVNARKRHLTAIALGLLRELRPDSEFNTRVATFALFGMMNWLYNWYRPGQDVPVEHLVRDITRLFLCGFLTPGVAAEVADLATAPGLQA